MSTNLSFLYPKPTTSKRSS
ncbi:hypothetical protein CFP56_006757 [Quercus suber]|uniref:Uncharacterized protein n=1 Tax=Quercus suber TaxID=58331 RepID=A0AAW0L6H4_QUESU